MFTHVLALVVNLLIALGVFLICMRRVSVSRSRRLERPATVVLGLLALGTAVLLCAIEAAMFGLFVLMGTGIEGRRKTPQNEALDAQIRLRFFACEMAVLGVFFLIAGLGALLSAQPKTVTDTDDRRDRGG